ncbi:MAG: glycosyltransferase [Candidatus Moranbacteria bacterium]|nr:glycosyltransferase [Candidatus Moranbacteria bacterium]
MLKASIIYVNHGSGSLIKRNIKKIAADGKAVQLEIIIVDNGEFDKNNQRIELNVRFSRETIKKFADFKIIKNKKNFGFAKACNLGAKLARAQVLVFLNPDCFIDCQALLELAKSIKIKKKIVAAAPIILEKQTQKKQKHSFAVKNNFREKLFSTRIKKIEQKQTNKHYFKVKKFQKLAFATGACLAVEKKAFKQIGGFDEKFFLYFEDKDLCNRIREQSWMIVQNKAIAACHWRKSSAIKWSLRKKRYYQAQNHYWRKYYPGYLVMLLKFLRTPKYLKQTVWSDLSFTQAGKQNKQARKLFFVGLISTIFGILLGFLWLKTLLVLIATWIAFFVFIKSREAFLLFLLFLPVLPALNLAQGIDLASSRILILLMALIWLLKGILTKKFIIPVNPTAIFLSTFFVWSAFSLVHSPVFSWSLRKLLVFLSIFPLFWVTYGLLVKNRFGFWHKIMKTVAATGVLLSLIGLGQFFIQFLLGKEAVMNFYAKVAAPIWWGQTFTQAVVENPSWLVAAFGQDLMRVISVLPDPHMMCFFLSFALPAQLYQLLPELKRENINVLQNKRLKLWFLAITMSLSCLGLTFSRGGYLGFLLGVGVIGILVGIRKLVVKAVKVKQSSGFFCLKKINGHKEALSRRKLLAKAFRPALFGLLILVLIIYLFWSQNPIAARLSSSFDVYEGSNQGRIELWRQGWGIFLDNWLVGVGLGAFAYEVDATLAYRDPVYAHNLYLEFLIELGLPGLIVWLAIWFFLSLALIRKYLSAGRIEFLILILSLSWFAGHAFFEMPIYSPVILPYLMIYLAMSSWLIKQT